MTQKFTMPPEQEERDYKVIPEGTHVARCISFIDIGTHPFEWQGVIKEPRKVRIAWETPNETAEFQEGEGEKPFLVSTELTLSFHPKSNLFAMLSGWMGFVEGDKIDPEKDLIGKECLINIKHEKTKKGNTYAKVMGVTPIMKGTECPEQVNKSTYFFMGYTGHPSEFDEEVFEGLPTFIKDKIMASPEWEDAHKEKPNLVGKKLNSDGKGVDLNSDGEQKVSDEEINKILS